MRCYWGIFTNLGNSVIPTCWKSNTSLPPPPPPSLWKTKYNFRKMRGLLGMVKRGKLGRVSGQAGGIGSK